MVFARTLSRQACGMKVAVFHPGTQHSRQTALALQQLGQLAFLATGLFDRPGGRLRRLATLLPESAGQAMVRELNRFTSPLLDPQLVRSFARYELPERILARAGFGGAASSFDSLANDRFARRIAKMASAEGPFALWGYDNSSLTAFRHRAAAHVPKILDRTIADWREWNAAIDQIAVGHGDWLGPQVRPASARLIERSEAEYELADHVVCGSPFVIDSVKRHSGVPEIEGKLHLLPYGFDPSLFGNAPAPAVRPVGEPVRFLFAGQLSARKGIQHVLEAIQGFGPEEASLTCVGSIHVPEARLAPLSSRVDFRGPLARAEMPAVMQAHDVLVLPSYFEGSAVVLLEALASGMAIISTPQAGLGPSPSSGVMIDKPDTDLLGAAMERLTSDRDLLVSMRRAAIADAAKYNHDAYRRNIAAFLAGIGI